ncbi:alpha/beta hydrolase [Paracoccus aestuariivivens]|uniref:Alpha/beta hydrolase fold domain-containing protein n=1 Tax=Paracoccus aestuariivivens TaxID=1820333 RepID=A0A6L6JDP4_9RHOB|nr:alpha/beta hydrolase [Paracoccus aestuariivivens]MTH78727.1 alpha/beta hydrolase fold domain-containing protein [Paracoccus aestuariivivens]
MFTRRSALAFLAGAIAAPALASPGKSPQFVEMAYSSNSPRNKMDIHLPAGRGPFPVLLDIHGGGFLTGDKRDLSLPQQVLDRGIAIVRMNYRLSNQARWPAPHEDVLAAAAFLQKHGAELELRPDQIALSGRSAGAFLAVSAALSMVQQGTPPAAVVNFYGPMDFGSMDQDMAKLGLTTRRPPADSPESVESLLVGYAVGDRRQEATAMGPVGRLNVMAQGVRLPPLMIRHGMVDNIVAAQQAEHLRTAWQNVDPHSEIDFALLPDEGHGTAAFGGDKVLGDLAAFLARNLRIKADG